MNNQGRGVQSSDLLRVDQIPITVTWRAGDVIGSPSRTVWNSPKEDGCCDQEKEEKDVGQTKTLNSTTDSEGAERYPCSMILSIAPHSLVAR